MQESSTRGTSHPSVLQFRQDLEVQLRRQVREAIETVKAWPTTRIQRCTTHKGRNLADAFLSTRGRS
jgi:hypothetical protein